MSVSALSGENAESSRATPEFSFLTTHAKTRFVALTLLYTKNSKSGAKKPPLQR
jgi:hypothetical protein